MLTICANRIWIAEKVVIPAFIHSFITLIWLTLDISNQNKSTECWIVTENRYILFIRVFNGKTMNILVNKSKQIDTYGTVSLDMAPAHVICINTLSISKSESWKTYPVEQSDNPLHLSTGKLKYTTDPQLRIKSIPLEQLVDTILKMHEK